MLLNTIIDSFGQFLGQTHFLRKYKYSVLCQFIRVSSCYNINTAANKMFKIWNIKQTVNFYQYMSLR